MRILLVLYRAAGKKKFLEPIPIAMEYLRRSRLPDGRLARSYELKTNKPLYLTRGDYQLTYSDANMPTHYSFKVADGTESIEHEYARLLALDPDELGQPTEVARPRMTRSLAGRGETVIERLDEKGRWVESGRMREDPEDAPIRRVIDSRTFINNVRALSSYLV